MPHHVLMFQTGIGLIVNKGVKSESLPGLARIDLNAMPCLRMTGLPVVMLLLLRYHKIYYPA